jgi:signal transduction histidine kinase
MSFSATPQDVIRALGVLLGYGTLFLLFETQATFFEVGPGVSLYYPSAGLNLALLLVFGVQYTPAIFVAGWASSAWINTPAIPLHHFFVPGLLITAGSGIVAWWLRRMLRTRTLFAPGAVLRLVGAMAMLAAWNALSAVGGYLLTGMEGYTFGTAGFTALLWWVADWAGMLIFTPPLLIGAFAVFAPPSLGLGAEHTAPRRSLTPRSAVVLLGEVGAIALSLYAAFFLLAGPSHLLYLCFLPLLWMALRHGLARSTLGVLLITLGAASALRALDDPGSMFQLQLFVITLALTGLFLGALVSERKRAFRTLQRGLDAFDSDGPSSDSSRSPRLTLDDDGLLLARTLQANQQQLADRAGALRDQNRRKDQLFGIIAHDLNNLVGTSASLASVLDEEADTLSSDTRKRFIHHLKQSAWQAHDLLDDLLEWGRVYVDESTNAQDTVHVASFVEAAIDQVDQQAVEKRIQLEHDVDPALTVQGHRGLLQSVVRNLLSNAIKFTNPGGCVEIHAESGADHVTISVEDDGVGIPAEDLQGLFDPRSGASRPGTQGEQGTGLGLVLCRDIVEQHGGTIQAESQPGQGSSFSFTLPAASSASP